VNDETYFFLKMTTRIVIGVVLCVWAISSCVSYQNRVFMDGNYIECPQRGTQTSYWVESGDCK
jgi:hypothetical protein